MTPEEQIEKDIAEATEDYTFPTCTLDRPVVVKRSDIVLNGKGHRVTRSYGSDGIVVAPPEWLPPTAGRFGWLPGMPSERVAYNTGGNTALLFWGTGAQRPRLGGGSAGVSGWDNVNRIQVSVWVEKPFGSSWRDYAGLGMFGMRCPDGNHPGPVFFEWHPDAGLRMIYRTADELNRVGPVAPYPASPEPERREITFYLDLTSGTWETVENGSTVATGSTGVLPPLEATESANLIVGSSFSDHGHPYVGPPVTYLGMTWAVNAPIAPPAVANDWYYAKPSTVFLLGGNPPEGQFYGWFAACGRGHGMLVRAAPGDVRTERVSVRDLEFTCGDEWFGSAVAAYSANHLSVERVRSEKGAFGVSQPFGPANSYWSRFADLYLKDQGTAAVHLDSSAVVWEGLNTVKDSRDYAVFARGTNLVLSHLFYAFGGSAVPMKGFVRLLRSGRSYLKNVQPNNEGAAPPPYWYEVSPTTDYGAGDSVFTIGQCGAQGCLPGTSLRLFGSPAVTNATDPVTGLPLPPRKAYYRLETPLFDDPEPFEAPPEWTPY